MSETSAARLPPGPSTGSAEHGLGQLVHAELVHLRGELDLGIGVEPEAEESLGRLAGPGDVAGDDGQAYGQDFPALHRLLVERLERVGDLRSASSGSFRCARNSASSRSKLGSDLEAFARLGQFRECLVLVVVPPLR